MQLCWDSGGANTNLVLIRTRTLSSYRSLLSQPTGAYRSKATKTASCNWGSILFSTEKLDVFIGNFCHFTECVYSGVAKSG